MRLLSVSFGRPFVGFVLLLWCAMFTVAQDTDQADDSAIEYTEEEQRQIDLAGRFLTILQRNPREGTALERVYGHHLEFGTLDEFIEKLEAELKEDATNGASWMVLGMVQARRGEDTAAIEAYEKAEELRAEDPIPPYYLGQTLLRMSKRDEAVAAMERALARDPQRNDELEIFQQLGRIHQRAQRTEEALKVWKRLEEQYPDDTRVLEQIATTLADEGEPTLALERYQRLTDLERDDYRRTMYRVKVAELTIKTDDRMSGIAAFEAILADLNPEGWLYRDVRRRIETTFLQSGDQDSLVEYYETWLEKNPEDVEGMVRLAQFLASTARMPEARKWMDKAVTLAPSRGELRKAYIRLLVDNQQFTEAAEQYRLLSESDPDDPDVLMDWGKLVMRDSLLPIEDRKKEADRIWRMILKNQPEDALTHAQVADAFRHAEMKDEALELYIKAVELAPGDPQYREYLGEYYHILKQPEKAKETWLAISAPPNRTADNLARAAEVFHGFGFLDDAIKAITEACEVDPKDFALHMKASDYQSQGKNYEKSLALLDKAEELATYDDQKDAVIAQRIEIYQSSDQLSDRTEEMAAEVNAKPDATAEDWNLLARFYEAGREFEPAARAIEAALEVDPKSITALSTAARIAETAGDFGRASEISRELAEIDRRSRGDHLMSVVRLELVMGRHDDALAAAEELIRSAPGNTEHYQFYAQTCFRLGRTEEGLEALRKAVRINPNEPSLIMALGTALGDQFKTREAIELYWRAFDKTEELEDKTTLVTKLVPLYDQLNEFDALIERLETNRRSEDQRRAMTICIAQAYQSIGDTGAARMELESLLSQNTRDTNLLQQLAKLCESSGDMDAAIDYQQQLVAIAPGHETEFPLAMMLQTVGRTDEASQIYLRLTRREEDPKRLLTSLDSLLSQGNYESVVKITEPLLGQNQSNWEVLYRSGVALAQMDKDEEAEKRFRSLLELELPHDSLGIEAKERVEQERRRARSNNLQGRTTTVQDRYSPYQLFSMAHQIRQETGYQTTAQEVYATTANRARIWTPDVFGHARMAAYGWILQYLHEQDQENKEEQGTAEEDMIASLEQRAKAEDASHATIWDYLYVCNLRTDGANIFEIAKSLAKEGNQEDKTFFLSSLRMRHRTPSQNPNEEIAQTPNDPLSEEDVDLMLECYQQLGEQEAPQVAAGSQIVYASNGQAYIRVGSSYQLLQGVYRSGRAFMTVVSSELRLANRDAKADEIFEAGLAEAESAQELMSTISLLQSEDKYDRIPEFYEQWLAAAKKELTEDDPSASSGSTSRTPITRTSVYPIIQWIGRLAPSKEDEEIEEILLSYLDLSVTEIILEREQAAKKPGRRVTSSSNTAQRRIGVQTYYGSNANYVQVETLFEDSLVPTSVVQVLRECFEVFKQNGDDQRLADLLEQHLKQTEDARRPYHQLILAQVLYWGRHQEEVLDLVTKAAAQFPDQADFQLQIAQLHLNRDNFDEAMKLADSVESFDPAILQERELIALRAAERLGDFDRARKAAETLFGMRLDSQMQIQLAQTMQRLGMNDLSDAILARAERTIGNDPQALASMMRMYQSQGKADQAKQAARLLLRRTTVPSLGNVRTSNASRDAAVRSQAIKVLQQAGELEQMIEDLEERIERSPNSPRFYQELAELFNATGDRSKVLPLLEKAVSAQPKAVDLRMQLAQTLESTNKRSEACDQYLIILKEQPQTLMRELSRIRSAFQSANRLDDLANVLVDVDSRQISQPHYVLDIAQQVLRKDADSEVGLKLLEKVYDDFPNYRSQLLSNATPQIFQNDRFFALARQSLVPTANQVKADPWFGFHQIRSFSSNGTVRSTTTELLTSLKDSPKLTVIQQMVKQSISNNGDWYGGQALLAQIELTRGKNDAARKQLKSLLENEKAMEKMSGTACWLVGQLAFEIGEMEDECLELYQEANDRPQTTFTSSIRYSPLARLITLYKERDRIEEAKELIMKSVDNVNTNVSNQAYVDDSRAQNYLWGAEQLRTLNCPIDAMRLYQKMIAKRDELENAAAYRGRQVEYYEQQAKKGIEQSIELMTKSDAKFDPKLLLTADPNDSPEVPALDLMLSIPTPDKLGTAEITSSLVNLVLQLCKDDEMATAFEKRLIELRTERPDDISIPVLLLILQKDKELPGMDETVKQLASLLDANPLPTPEDTERPSVSERRIAACSLPLWLAAKRITEDQAWKDGGKLFADRSLAAARLQSDDTTMMAYLYAYGDHVLKMKHREEAENSWEELLALVTKRPESARRNASEKTLLPPLVLSQFQTAIAVAKQAAENDMPQLSRDALLESLKAGIPVADAPSTSSNSRLLSAPSVIRTSSGIVRSSSQADAMLQAISTKTIAVVQLWKGTMYPDEATYEVLRGVVLPESRRNECFLYPVARKTNDTKVECLADHLIRAAKSAGKMDELRSEVESRKKKSTNTLMFEILLGKMAMARSDLPAANEHLVEIVAQLITATNSDSIELACHIALPAIEQEELSENAFTIIKLAAKSSQETTSTNLGTYVSDKLSELVCEYAMKHGNPQAVQEHFDNLLVARQVAYSRYGGDYGMYMQRQDLMNFADQAARIGAGDLSLDFMGRAYDFEVTNYGTPSFKESLESAIDYTRSLSPENRYKAWAKWTLPTPERKTFRSVLQSVTPFRVPAEFVTKEFDIQPLHGATMLSNLSELVSAAKSADRLDELTQTVQQHFDAGIEGANHLYALCLIAGSNQPAAEDYLAVYFDEIASQHSKPANERDKSVMNSILAYYAALETGIYFEGYPDRFTKFRDVILGQNGSQVSYITEAYYAKLDAEDGSSLISGSGTNLKHWSPATLQAPLVRPKNAVWAQHEDRITQLTGPPQSWLQWNFPVVGDFEFSFDAFGGPSTSGGFGYGGATINVMSSGRMLVVYSSGAEILQRNQVDSKGKPSFERFTVRRQGDTCQFLSNGYVVYEEKLAGTSPWLMLVTSGSQSGSFKNFQVSGNPVVPKEIQLVAGNRMDGWNTEFFSESQPRHHVMAEPTTSSNSSLARDQQREPSEFDWKVEDDILLGRAVPDLKDADSWVFYQRPLQEGDSVRYEFYYEPKKTLVSPTFGRIGILLTSDGVMSHWLTSEEEKHWVDPQNQIKEEAYCQADSIALRENDWNQAELQIQNSNLIVKINGQSVYQRPVAEFGDSRFGIHRFKEMEGKVRNVTLSGNWPTDTKQLINSESLATTKPLTHADHKMAEMLSSPELARAMVREVIAKAAELDDQAAYELLSRWILPNADRQEWRIYFDYPVATVSSNIELQDYLVSPAVEMVHLAGTLSQLEQLKSQVDALKPTGDVAARSKHVLLALIALEADDWETARSQYQKLFANLQQPLSKDLTEAERMPELLLAIQYAKHPEVWKLGMSLARTFRDQERDGEKSSGNSHWRMMVEAAYGAIEFAQLGDEVRESDKRLTQWSEVPYVAANMHGRGYHFSQWVYEPGVVSQIPGDTWNQLFFQSPLTGSYEILAERSILGHREGVISVGRRSAEPRYDLKKVRVITVGHGQTDEGSELEIPNWKGMAKFRIVVDGNTITTYTNGVKIHEDKLPGTPDPWVVLQSHLARNAFEVRNLRIVGEPKIPKEIDLIESTNWWAWRSDFYSDWHSQDHNANATYVKKDGEIFGNLRKDRSASPLESLMMYSRPMLEDGEIEYEVFYEPGQFEIHPALGRTAFLLEKDGVATHQLTDARWETSDLAVDNRTPLSETAPALVENGWNKIRLAVQGDKLTVQVNGKEVAQQQLTTPKNERFFGLFRYSDKTEARVRNMKYRGDWPKSLPKVEDQQLAYSRQGPLVPYQAEFGQTQEVNLAKSYEALKSDGLKMLGPAGMFSVVDDKLGLQLEQGGSWGRWPGVEKTVSLTGDTEITVDFQDLNLKSPGSGWGCNFSLVAHMDDTAHSSVENAVGVTAKGDPINAVSYRGDLPGQNGSMLGYEAIRENSAVGRLRLVRLGGQIHCLSSWGENQPFRLIHSFTVGNAKIRSISIRAKASDDAAVVNCAIGNLVIRDLEPAQGAN